MSHPPGFPPSGPDRPSPGSDQPQGGPDRPQDGPGVPLYGQGLPQYGQDLPQYGQGTFGTGNWQPDNRPGSPTTTKRSSATPWVIAVVAVLIAVGGVVWGLRSSTTGEDGATGLQTVVVESTSASADEAVRTVAARLAAGEVDGAFESFAVTRLAQNWDQVAYLERLRAASPQDPPNPRDPFFEESFTLYRLGQIAGQLRYLALSLTVPEELADVLDYRTLPLNDDLTAQQVVDGMMVGNLEGLTVDRVEPVALTQSERYQESMAPLRQIYGADELLEYGVLYSYQGQTWMGGATALRYGDRWLLLSLQSPMINQSSSGALTRATAEEFEAAVSAD